MSSSTRIQHKSLSPAAAVTALCALLFLAAAALGYFFAGHLLDGIGGGVSLHVQPIYDGCDLAPEYAVRAATICRPIVLESCLLLWALYVPFEKALLASLFFLRGIALGAALKFSIMLHAPASLLALLSAYVFISIVYLILLYIQRSRGDCRFSEEALISMIAGGGCCAALLLSSALPV